MLSLRAEGRDAQHGKIGVARRRGEGRGRLEGAALQPDMRAYIEWQASMGYQKFDLKKSNALLESAFTATGDRDKKVLIVVSDGADNASRHDLSDVLRQADDTERLARSSASSGTSRSRRPSRSEKKPVSRSWTRISEGSPFGDTNAMPLPPVDATSRRTSSRRPSA